MDDSKSANRRRLLRRLLRHKQFLTGSIILSLLVFVAIGAPWISRYDPFERDFNQRLKPPSGEHWFGTDLLGRDLFSQIAHGARLTLYVGLVSVAISFIFRVTLGVSVGRSGYQSHQHPTYVS